MVLLYLALFGAGVVTVPLANIGLRRRKLPINKTARHRQKRVFSKLATQRYVAMGNRTNYFVHHGKYTFIETWNCETDFTAARIIYGSAVGGENFGVGGAVVSATERTIDPDSKRKSDTSAENFLPVTFNNKGASVRYEEQELSGKDRSVREILFPPLPNVSDGNSVWSPRLIFSDWISIQSVVESSVVAEHCSEFIAWLKMVTALPAPKTVHRDGIDASDMLTTTGNVYQKIYLGGDYVFRDTFLAEESLSPVAIGRGAVYAVQFITKHAGATVQAVGDSILQGIGFECGPYAGGYVSFAHLACSYLSSPRLPVTLLQSSLGGEPSADFFASARADLEHSDIAVALIQTWSGNDINKTSTPAQSIAAADASWRRSIEYAALVRAQGGIPVFLSAVPQAPKMGSVEAEQARLSSVERCHALARKGELVLDLNGILGDGAKIANYKAQWLWIDNVHPNTAAHYALAERTAELIRMML